MKVQNVNAAPFRNNFTGKKKNDIKQSNLLVKSSIPKSIENDKFEKNLLAATLDSEQRRKNEEINDYLYTSKKEAKDLKKVVSMYKKLFFSIFKAAKKSNYQKSINFNDYSINFGYIDSKTNIPSSINIWKNSRPIRQYTIFSVKPLDIEVYDNDNNDNTEKKYKITDEGLLGYISVKNKTDEVEFIMPTKDGFYKLEGVINPNGEYLTQRIYVDKRKEINYIPQGFSFYTEYTENGKKMYKSENTNTKWSEYQEG